VYNAFLKEKEFTYMRVAACLANCFGAVMTMFYCRGFTFGIPGFLYLMMTSTVTDTLYQTFNTLPLMILFAKIIPEKIEASLFAFLMGLSNLSYMFLSGNLANLINILFVHIDYNPDDPASLDRVWELYAIQASLSLVPLLFLWLIPNRAQVAKVQRCYEYIDMYVDKEDVDAGARAEDFEKLSPKTAARCNIKKPEGGEEIDPEQLRRSAEQTAEE